MSEQELKKCPACGGEAEFSKYHAVFNDVIICNNCEIMQMEMDECKVLEAWNNQPRIEELKQRNKEIEARLKEAEEYCNKTIVDLSFYTGGDYHSNAIDNAIKKELRHIKQLLKGGE